MWVLRRSENKKCSIAGHFWVLKFKQGTKEPFVVCSVCGHSEKVSYQSDYQKQILLEKFFK